jgi:hypothetical protein
VGRQPHARPCPDVPGQHVGVQALGGLPRGCGLSRVVLRLPELTDGVNAGDEVCEQGGEMLELSRGRPDETGLQEQDGGRPESVSGPGRGRCPSVQLAGSPVVRLSGSGERAPAPAVDDVREGGEQVSCGPSGVGRGARVRDCVNANVLTGVGRCGGRVPAQQ